MTEKESKQVSTKRALLLIIICIISVGSIIYIAFSVMRPKEQPLIMRTFHLEIRSNTDWSGMIYIEDYKGVSSSQIIEGRGDLPYRDSTFYGSAISVDIGHGARAGYLRVTIWADSLNKQVSEETSVPYGRIRLSLS